MLGRYLRRRALAGQNTIVAYLPGLYPDPEHFEQCVASLVSHGIAILEFGIPGKTPPLEGDTISTALRTVERRIGDPLEVLQRASAMTRSAGAYPVAMVFAHTLHAVGLARFVREAAEAEVSAVLIPDILEERRASLHHACSTAGIESVAFFGADEVQPVLYGSEAFVYLQTADMPTGGRFEPTNELRRRIEQVRVVSRANGDTVPVALGFGIRSGADIASVHRLGADIAVVGTAMVEAAAKPPSVFSQYLEELTAVPNEQRMEND